MGCQWDVCVCLCPRLESSAGVQNAAVTVDQDWVGSCPQGNITQQIRQYLHNFRTVPLGFLIAIF